MKAMVLAAAVATGLAGTAGADPVLGVWQTQVDDGAYAHVNMDKCGEAICGVIARTFRSGGEYDSPNKGKRIVWDMEPKGGGTYGGGKIWQPSTDKVYRSKMELKGDRLGVSGCVAVFCKEQTWARVK
ncbi:Uncharacterized conserved protein, DUF2147 family [Salinihabitans flavidus]|uniref:Uncharacterized conserved protein, DUF2147 family n=1 Tax=Salinihabitans flavidus TaxID=569882 RepID=A0A1H8LGA4_9RHOB|nr:DUF2147 domain-containing protein [Salinihabitans flavidus]SEO04190.1 Uncharacterized conserved protein, DUF2147 family [Salinihabitans flavidus]